MKYCSNCENKLNENDKFCGKCGVKINSASIKESKSINPNRKNKSVVNTIITLVALVFIITIIIKFNIEKNDLLKETSRLRDKSLEINKEFVEEHSSNDNEFEQIKNKANLFLLDSSSKTLSKMLNGEYYEDVCYKISEDKYSGSVRIWYENGSSYTKIWLSDGSYYLTGEEKENQDTNFEIIKSDKIATTNCED